MPRTICLDFDGVLNTYDGWKGPEHLFEPREGAREFVAALKALGFEVVVHSTRNGACIRSWLDRHGFACIEVVDRKPAAVCYVDDRALTFRGNYQAVLDEVQSFKAWWEPRVDASLEPRAR